MVLNIFKRKKIIKIFIILFSSFWSLHSEAQTAQELSIEDCYNRAEQYYPLIQQYDILDKINELTLDNIFIGNYPSISIFGQATYQSDVTSILLDIPGTEMQRISKAQYKVYGEITKSLTDSKNIKKQQEIFQSKSDIERRKLDVNIYHVKEKVNHLYFGVLLIDQQLIQSELLKKDITTGINKLEIAVANGTAIQNNITQLKAEALQIDQKVTTLQSHRTALTNILSILINMNVDNSITFVQPAAVIIDQEINRPELSLFDLQSKSITIENDLIDIKNRPRVLAFVQTGFGKPALNFLSNDLDPYYIGGLKFNWNINRMYTKNNEKNLLLLRQQSIDVQKDLFLFNTNMAIQEESEEIEKLNKLIAMDEEIVRLRNEVKQTAQTQLENGVITSNDYLTYVNAEDKARQNQILHQIQLIKNQYTINTTTGN